MKKTIISLLLVMALLSMSVSVFAGNYDDPRAIRKTSVEQTV